MSQSHEALNQNQISGYFRANVGILLINKAYLVLAAERSERPGAWQLPQGGIDQGEEEEQAAMREMREELGFDKQDINDLLQPLGTHPGWFAYQLPKADWSEKNGRGQAQKYFAYRFIGEDDQLDEKLYLERCGTIRITDYCEDGVIEFGLLQTSESIADDGTIEDTDHQ
jgi:8-oxo-dGTP pyrophosphatase MutT (NUDIX family)